MDENNKAGGNKALIFASAVLIAVLLTLGIYWARASKTAQSAPAAQAEPATEAYKLEPATEAGQPAEAAEVEPAGPACHLSRLAGLGRHELVGVVADLLLDLFTDDLP